MQNIEFLLLHGADISRCDEALYNVVHYLLYFGIYRRTDEEIKAKLQIVIARNPELLAASNWEKQTPLYFGSYIHSDTSCTESF